MPQRKTFTRFVQVGRVVLVKSGEYENKLCVIIDVIDANRALVDSPKGQGVSRQPLLLKNLALTDFVVPIRRSCKRTTLEKAWTEQDISNKWAKTSTARRLAVRARRAASTDFERFKVMKARKQHRQKVRTTFNKLLVSRRAAQKA